MSSGAQTPAVQTARGGRRRCCAPKISYENCRHLTLPTLTLTSSASLSVPGWRDETRHRDMLINVRQVWRLMPSLATNLEFIRVRGAVHDVFLSTPEPAGAAYGATRDWLHHEGVAQNLDRR